VTKTASPASNGRRGRRDRQRGGALVELAVIVSMLSLLVIGIMDFGRIGYSAMALTGAARAGAMYGSMPGKDDKFTQMQDTAKAAAANDIGLITATATRICECQVGAATPTVINCTSGTCAGTQRNRVSVTVTKTFALIRAFPQLPTNVTLTRTAVMRSR
jgi:Flp pilus assembly protein TadG